MWSRDLAFENWKKLPDFDAKMEKTSNGLHIKFAGKVENYIRHISRQSVLPVSQKLGGYLVSKRSTFSLHKYTKYSILMKILS